MTNSEKVNHFLSLPSPIKTESFMYITKILYCACLANATLVEVTAGGVTVLVVVTGGLVTVCVLDEVTAACVKVTVLVVVTAGLVDVTVVTAG